MEKQYYPRVLRSSIEADLAIYPVVAVMGVRQVGKTTLCREIAAARRLTYFTLDDNDVRRRAQQDPSGFVADIADEGAAIDEVQRAPEFLLTIKSVVDRDE